MIRRPCRRFAASRWIRLGAFLALAASAAWPSAARADLEFLPRPSSAIKTPQQLGVVVSDMTVAQLAASAPLPGPVTADSIPPSVHVSSDGKTISNSSGFSIVLNPDAGLSSNSAALAAFDRAAARWVSEITNPITVHIDAGLDNLNSPNVLGQTSSVLYIDNYTSVRNALAAHGASQGAKDAILTALPTASEFSASLPSGFSLSGYVEATAANFKALNIPLPGHSATDADATITFNSIFAFAYDNTHGVPSNQYDFESIAAHEIGHALGFFSSVDNVDYDQANHTLGAISPSTLDLFRFNAASPPTSAADFTSKPRELDAGVAAVTSDVTSNYPMSTGQNEGDGFQASHWKHQSASQPYVGVMDPAIPPGTIYENTAADYRAMELIGYNTINAAAVPEPASLVSLSLGLLLGARRLRRRAA